MSKDHHIGYHNMGGSNNKYFSETIEMLTSQYKGLTFKGGNIKNDSYICFKPGVDRGSTIEQRDILFKVKKTGNIYKLLNAFMTDIPKDKPGKGSSHLLHNVIIDTHSEKSCILVKRGCYQNFKKDSFRFLQIATFKKSFCTENAAAKFTFEDIRDPEKYKLYERESRYIRNNGYFQIDLYTGSLYLSITNEKEPRLININRMQVGYEYSIYCKEKDLLTTRGAL